ncbi:MAG: hypothetical protein LBC40_00895 [Dysgonamonadaceae bacterium]|nr:hypothetical protein [Dysgonamonadaceae bacterium]
MKTDTDLIVTDSIFATVFGLLGITAIVAAIVKGSWGHVYIAGGCALMVWVLVNELIKIIRRRRGI